MPWPFQRTVSQQERVDAKTKKKEDTKAERQRMKELVTAHPSARFPPTQVFYADPSFPEPPPLNYTLKTRYKAIAIFWTLVVIDCMAVPLILYFALWYCTSLSPNAVFSISTGALGSVSIFEYFRRFLRLWRKNSNCRVIGARRYYLDFFHWNLSIAWIAVMVELIVGTIPKNPPIRLLAMPVSSMTFAFGVQMLIIDAMRYLEIRAPVRISSLPRGAPLRPGIYSIIEDVIAVDGSGGTEFRQRLNLRFMASHHFRQMLHRLTLFWAVGALAISAGTTAIIFTTEKNVAYVCGWTVPFGWAAIWTLLTVYYVKRNLKEERELWTQERGKA
jgi:multisubunit Na+/H+ antiporter MnhE subunit